MTCRAHLNITYIAKVHRKSEIGTADIKVCTISIFYSNVCVCVYAASSSTTGHKAIEHTIT